MFPTSTGAPDGIRSPLRSEPALISMTCCQSSGEHHCEDRQPRRAAPFYDATIREDFHQELLRLIASATRRCLFRTARRPAKPRLRIAAATARCRTRSPRSSPAGVRRTPRPLRSARNQEKPPQPPRTRRAQRRVARRAKTAAARIAFCRRSASRGRPARCARFQRISRRDWLRRAAFARRLSRTVEYFNPVMAIRLFLKLFRRLQPEENPDVEVGRFLTEIAHFQRIPPFLGEISMSSARRAKRPQSPCCRDWCPNEGDGWQWFLERAHHWLASVADRPAPASRIAPDFRQAGGQ